MIDHCIAVLQKENEEKLYRIYITDSLKLISENTAGLTNGKYMTKRFCDIAYDVENKELEKSAEEIIEEVTKNAGLVVKKNESV